MKKLTFDYLHFTGMGDFFDSEGITWSHEGDKITASFTPKKYTRFLEWRLDFIWNECENKECKIARLANIASIES